MKKTAEEKIESIVAYTNGIGLKFNKNHIAYFKSNGCTDEDIASFETNRNHPKLIQGLYDMYGPCIHDWTVPFHIVEYDAARYTARIVHEKVSENFSVEAIVLEQHISLQTIIDMANVNDRKALARYLENLDNVVVVD